jgi:hypothetical protein
MARRFHPARAFPAVALVLGATLLVLAGSTGARSPWVDPNIVPANQDVKRAYSTTRTGCEYTPATEPEWDTNQQVNHIPGPPNQLICGTAKRDMIHPTGPNVIWGRQGNDTIHARNFAHDKIDGHQGHDRVFADKCDTVANAEWINRRSGKCKGVKKRGHSHSHARLAAISSSAYPAYEAIVECRLDAAGKSMMRFAESPAMRARDSTARVDWQFVAWTSHLYKLEGTEWVYTKSQTDWLWDWTYDEQVGAFPGNAWRNFKTNQRWFVWYRNLEAGAYRISIKYRWYTGKGKHHEETYWAGEHFGPYETANDHESCTFPPTAAAGSTGIKALGSA